MGNAEEYIDDNYDSNNYDSNDNILNHYAAIRKNLVLHFHIMNSHKNKSYNYIHVRWQKKLNVSKI